MKRRVFEKIRALEQNPWPANLDVCPVVGHEPWMRVRVGDFRILIRPLSDDELVTLGVALPEVGYYVARAVDKQYVARAIRRLAS